MTSGKYIYIQAGHGEEQMQLLTVIEVDGVCVGVCVGGGGGGEGVCVWKD